MYHSYMVVILCLGAKWYAKEGKYMGFAYSFRLYGSTRALRMLTTRAREHVAEWTTQSSDPEEPSHMKGISTAVIDITGASGPAS